MEWLTCLFMVNLISGCFLFKMFKTLNEFCFLSKVDPVVVIQLFAVVFFAIITFQQLKKNPKNECFVAFMSVNIVVYSSQ